MRFLALYVFCFLIIDAKAPLLAANTVPPVVSEWLGTGGLDQDGTYHTFVVLMLPKGWHSYWRTPGDAGMAPQMDFAGSRNIESTEARYPAPKREDDAGTVTLIYTGTVVVPLHITPAQANAPVDGHLAFSFGLCEQICVPANANLALRLDPEAKAEGGNLARLASAEALIPHSESATDRIKLSEPSLALDASGKPQVILTVTAPDATTPVDLFAEGPSEWALGQPTALAAQGAIHRFSLSLDGIPQGVNFAENPLTFTIASPLENIESIRTLPTVLP